MSSNQNSYHLGVQTTSHPCMCKRGKKCPVDADGTRRERLLRGDLRYCSMTTAHPGRKFYRHLACITPQVIENMIEAYGSKDEIPGMRTAGMSQAFEVAERAGSYEEVQEAFANAAASTPA